MIVNIIFVIIILIIFYIIFTYKTPISEGSWNGLLTRMSEKGRGLESAKEMLSLLQQVEVIEDWMRHKVGGVWENDWWSDRKWVNDGGCFEVFWLELSCSISEIIQYHFHFPLIFMLPYYK